MNRKIVKCLVYVILVVLCIPSSQVAAFDGHRKGFIIGFGLGVGIYSTANLDEINYPDGQHKIFKHAYTIWALMSDRVIGYAPSDLWEFYLFNKNAFTGFFDNGDGVIGVGISKISASQIPANYFAIGVGIPYMETISWKFNRDSFGLFGGWGYEFRKHLNLEFDLLYGYRVSRHGVEKETDNNFSFRFSLNALAY